MEQVKPNTQRPVTPPVIGLGDVVEKALSIIGITEDRVSRWMGGPCGCVERKEKLNQLSAWALRILSGKTKKAEEYLEEIIGETPNEVGVRSDDNSKSARDYPTANAG
jgi:hypothetical protein